MRIGLIRSRLHDVVLWVPSGSMLDADPGDCPGGDRAACAGDDPADVAGVNITLHALNGTIGTADNFLEIDLVDHAVKLGALNLGVLNAESVEDLHRRNRRPRRSGGAERPARRVRHHRSRRPAQPARFRSTTRCCSTSTAAPVRSCRASISRTSKRCASTSAQPGAASARAATTSTSTPRTAAPTRATSTPSPTSSIYVTETDDELSVLAAKSRTGTVRLTFPTRRPPWAHRRLPATKTIRSSRQPEDLILLVDGTSLIDQSTPLSRHHRPTPTPRRGRASGPRSTSRSGSATT